MTTHRAGPLDFSKVPESWHQAYRGLLDSLSPKESEAAYAAPCKPGSCMCCRGAFEISLADAVLLLERLRKDPPSRDAVARARATSGAIAARGWAYPHLGDPESLPPTYAEPSPLDEEPCPLLDAEGLCTVYTDRPSICRMQGTRYVDKPHGLTLEDACPKADATRRALPFDLAQFAAEEERLVVELAAHLGVPAPLDLNAWETVIAAAILWAEGGEVPRTALLQAAEPPHG